MMCLEFSVAKHTLVLIFVNTKAIMNIMQQITHAFEVDVYTIEWSFIKMFMNIFCLVIVLAELSHILNL